MIRVFDLFEQTQDKFSGAGSRFTRIFIDSVNRVSDDLFTYCGVEVPETKNQQEQIDLDPKIYKRCYISGVRYYLQDSAEWGREPDADAYGKYRTAIADAVGMTFEGVESGMPRGE